MLVKILYYRPAQQAYTSGRYTYSTALPLAVNDVVACPTAKGKQRGIVVETDADYDGSFEVKEITEYWTEEIEE